VTVTLQQSVVDLSILAMLLWHLTYAPLASRHATSVSASACGIMSLFLDMLS